MNSPVSSEGLYISKISSPKISVPKRSEVLSSKGPMEGQFSVDIVILTLVLSNVNKRYGRCVECRRNGGV